MQSENVMYYVDSLPSTLEQIDIFEAKFISEMEEKDPLNIAVQLKAMEELVNRLRANKKVREYIMSEVDKYPEKTFKVNGVNFDKAETGVKYDYSKCNDDEYNDILSYINDIDKKLKVRQKFLKALKEPVANMETGEIINPPLKTSNTYVKISLK